MPTKNSSEIENLSILRKMFFQRLPYRFLILALSLWGAVCSILSPFFQRYFVDGLAHRPPVFQAAALSSWPLPSLILGAFFMSLLGVALSMCANYIGTREGQIVQKELAELLYRKTLAQRAESLGNRTLGEIVSIYATDVAGATALVEQCFPMAAGILFPLAIAPVAVKWLCHIEISTTVGVIAGLTAFYLILARRQSRFFHLFKQLAAERVGIVNEWVQNIRLLRILGWTKKFETKIFSKRIEETQNRIRMVTNGQLMASVGSSISFFINLIGIGSLVFLRGGETTPGELFALLWIFGIFLARPLRQIPWVFTFSLDALTSIRRVESFLRESSPHDSSDLQLPDHAAPAAPAAEASGVLRVSGLNLEVGQAKLLNNISFSVAPGEFIAVVGEVGSGKSLLLLSLMGESAATFSEFTVSGRNLLSLPAQTRRRFFSYVPQEAFVMNASLLENIVFEYGAAPITEEQVRRSLKLAQFDIATERLSDGLQTEIGERGVNLSGGQRQRVGLARAHFFSRPIVLLDDCLSAVDVDTEENLVEHLISGAWREQSRILITHRLSVLKHVDRIFVMEKGRIAEIGTLSELSAKSVRFKNFIASVSRSEVQAAATLAERQL